MSFINEKQINMIFEIDRSGDLFARLLDIFETDLPILFIDLENALKENSLLNAKKISHCIKSSSLNMGASELANIASNFERSFSMNKSHDPDVVIELRNCFEYSAVELRDFLNLCKPK